MTVDISHAVQGLLEARRSGIQVAPPFALPDRDAVYAIQDGVAAATGPVAGWKVGARTPTAEPNPAPLLTGALVKSPARFDGKAMHMIGVEIEISFHIAHDIAARDKPVSREEALAAVGDAFVGMEVVDTRLADFKQADPEWLLADNQMNHALVVGDGVKVIVVDNSEVPTLDRVALPAGCTLITIGYNSGIAHAQNAGVEAALAAGAGVLVFFDQDSKIEPGFVKLLIAAIREGSAEIVSPLSVDEATNTPLPSVRVSRFGWSTPNMPFAVRSDSVRKPPTRQRDARRCRSPR